MNINYLHVLPGGHCLICHQDYDNGSEHWKGHDLYPSPATPCLPTCDPKWAEAVKQYPGMAPISTVKRIAFDVDGTLIKKTDNGDVPRYEIVQLAKTFIALGHTVFVWSGGGLDWARNWAQKLDLLPHVRIIPKRGDAYDIDIAFDDHATQLAKVDVIV